MTPSDKAYISNLLKAKFKKMQDDQIRYSKARKIKEPEDDRYYDSFFNREKVKID